MAMSLIWVAMVLFSVVAALLTGNVGVLSAAALEGAKSAITLSVSMAGVLCLWSGVCAIMEKCGLNRVIARLLSPLLRRLFPQASADEACIGYLSANVTANLLGLGNAATPLGIQAVQRMKALSGSETATDEMCLLIVMNTASIQLIPSTVAAVRSSLGAAAPFDLLPAVWLTSLCSVSAGILAARLFRHLSRT